MKNARELIILVDKAGLTQKDVDRLLADISHLSSSTAGKDNIILNFADGGEAHRGSAYCRDKLTSQGWNHELTVYFGEEDFSFGRYPADELLPNDSLGFSFYSR